MSSLLIRREAKLLRHEAYLLRWESYIRRTHHVAFWLAMFFFTMYFMSMMFTDDAFWQQRGQDFLFPPVILLLCTLTTRLQIRHIDSIRYHLEREKINSANEASPVSDNNPIQSVSKA